MLSGNAEVGIGIRPSPPLRKRKAKTCVCGGARGGRPFWGVTYSNDVAGRYAATGLRNLRVATFPAPSTAFTLQTAMFKKSGLPPRIVPEHLAPCKASSR